MTLSPAGHKRKNRDGQTGACGRFGVVPTKRWRAPCAYLLKLDRRHHRWRKMTETVPPLRLPIRVYYEDTDFSGFVQHVAYLRFFERGRTEFLRAHGIDQSALFAARELVFVVRKISVDYLKPARMDDELWVETAIVKIGGASIEMAQKILRGEELIAAAHVRIAALAAGRPQRLPSEIQARLGRPCGDII
jgi:acyl-CoA thioester hydrolase